MYTVVIVEDDPMIAELNRRYIERDGRFAVAHTFAQPRPALDWLRRNAADLVILDFYMPQMNGLELLQSIRAAGVAADVIMVTAANDAATVEALTRLGVVDYLVKPFAYERFCRALDAFCRRRSAMQGGSLDQDALDSLLHTAPPAALPKGLQPQTQERVLACLRAAPPHGYTSEEVAEAAGISVVTARRYLAYLAQQGLVTSTMNYGTGGRPSLIYRLTGGPRGG